jgi:hypothetical protein
MNDGDFFRHVSSWPFIAAVFVGLIVGYVGDIIAGKRFGTIAGGIACYALWVICARVSSRRARRDREESKKRNCD